MPPKERSTTLPRTREPKPPVSELQRSLTVLGAALPKVDQIAAVRAVARGTATPGQQRMAMTYLLGELCGIGKVTFAGEHTHGGAFRSGAQGVGIAFSQIADAVLFSFPGEGREPVPE